MRLQVLRSDFISVFYLMCAGSESEGCSVVASEARESKMFSWFKVNPAKADPILFGSYPFCGS
jgi:hypothetical protein